MPLTAFSRELLIGRNQSEHPTPLYMILEAVVENWRVHLRSTCIPVTVVSLPRPFREKRIIVYFCYSFFIIIRPSLSTGLQKRTTIPAAKRSRNSGARVATKRGRSLKANMDSAVPSGEHFVSDDENVEQKMRVAKRTLTNQTSANPERWTPYFNSKSLHALDDREAMQLAAAGDEQAGDSKGLETAAMQVCL